MDVTCKFIDNEIFTSQCTMYKRRTDSREIQWRPRLGKRIVGRPLATWNDDLRNRAGGKWMRDDVRTSNARSKYVFFILACHNDLPLGKGLYLGFPTLIHRQQSLATQESVKVAPPSPRGLTRLWRPSCACLALWVHAADMVNEITTKSAFFVKIVNCIHNQ